jgi:hypothetical protein
MARWPSPPCASFIGGGFSMGNAEKVFGGDRQHRCLKEILAVRIGRFPEAPSFHTDAGPGTACGYRAHPDLTRTISGRRRLYWPSAACIRGAAVPAGISCVSVSAVDAGAALLLIETRRRGRDDRPDRAGCTGPVVELTGVLQGTPIISIITGSSIDGLVKWWAGSSPPPCSGPFP